ncbi:MAG: Membrane-bound lytic murein transglycosylase F [Pseudomonas citronellolis]|nr:MAG: Membrane-bound lytic murein transglycosylase F [Pseudomonas citronellolis]
MTHPGLRLIAWVLALLPLAAQAAALDPAPVAALAPSGSLRASINLGNPLLAHLDANGQPQGVSVEVARELAHQLGVPLQLLTVKSAEASVHNVEDGQADIGFFAIDPRRAQAIHFSGPYVLIEGAYAVRADSPIRANAQVDAPGQRVAVSRGSAYDLFLTRSLAQATLVRQPYRPEVLQGLLDGRLTVVAGIRPQLQQDAEHLGGIRLLDPPFMQIRQAVGLPANRGEAATHWLDAAVQRLKDSGFITATPPT